MESCMATNGVATAVMIRAPSDTITSTPRQDTQGFYSDGWGSPHAGMMNMAFCDGSVHQISYGISLTIFKQLCNRADGNAIDASMY